ncbi:MAG: hypothetical protein ACFB14_20055 [Leptolyngbyaceae cyanobacterium]
MKTFLSLFFFAVAFVALAVFPFAPQTLFNIAARFRAIVFDHQAKIIFSNAANRPGSMQAIATGP